MNYQIGDIARILNVSTEMIRYYEKMGVIKPERNVENNYRTYTTMDLFALMEATQLKDFDINIKEINGLKSKEYTKTLIKYLKEYKLKVKHDIEFKNILLSRIEQLENRYKTIGMNCGNYWIKNIDAYYKYFMLTSKEDDYHDVETPTEIINYLYSDGVRVFVDSIVEFTEEKERWYLVLGKDDGDFLGAPPLTRETVSAGLCLCTTIDMGEIGQFSKDSLSPLIEYAEDNNYKQVDCIYGFLCARGVDGDKFHRYMELRMPIEL